MVKPFSYILNHFAWSKNILLSAVAVITGGLIYILFRPAEPVFFNWFSWAGIEHWLIAVREKSLSLSSLLPQWMVYSLTNGLWAFGYTLIVLSIWRGSNSFMKYIWFLTIPVLVFGFEVLQLTGVLQGTFCFNDLIWSAMGITLGSFISQGITRKNNENMEHDHPFSIDSSR